jgi:hypothetical protein
MSTIADLDRLVDDLDRLIRTRGLDFVFCDDRKLYYRVEGGGLVEVGPGGVRRLR